MRRMKRLLILTAASIASISVALPAGASTGRSVLGQVSAVSSTSISVAARGGITTTCAVGKRSPSTAGVKVGDRVRMLCLRHGHGRLMLAKLRTDRAAAAPSKETETVKFGGAITALDDSSISLHDGDRDLTCKLGDGSPSTGGFKVGQHVKVACADGVLVAIAAVGSGDVGRYFVGTVDSITDGSITLQTEHGKVTCKITPTSPSTASLKQGDKVGMGCRASTMELVLLRPVAGDSGAGGGTGGSTSAPPQQHITLKARGTVSALDDASISLLNDGGTVTCTIGSSSPSVSGIAVGDAAAMACVDGTLTAIATGTTL
jgi:hypothetical protein